MTQKDLLQMHLDLLDLQVGDTVKITHKVPENYLGVSYGWNSDMDECIGKTYKVENIGDDYVGLEEKDWIWHPACLELVSRKPAYTTVTFGLQLDSIDPEFVASVFAETVKVYDNASSKLLCSLDFDTVETIFKHMNKLSGKMLLTQGEE